jgi:hypothetical protein
MARIGWAVMMRQEDFRSQRHDQPCPDLGEPGAVLPTDEVRGLTALAVKTSARACGGGLRPVLTTAARGATAEPGRDEETVL